MMNTTSDLVRSEVVLVADDSPDALSLIHDTLEAANMDVLVALEGKQALTIAKRIRPDIILLDAIMPTMDGFEACKALKADPNLSTIPVIFMTGLSDTDDIVRGLEAGGVDYLTKPIQPNELIARMRVHLNNARQANNAQSALDSMGQYLMTATEQGSIAWATPQTYALLAKARASQAWQTTELAQQIRHWLSHVPETGNTLKLDGLEYPLSIKMMGYTEQKEALLKLEDGVKPTEVELLKSELNLTDRESEVLRWIANGKTNREIAEILEMSPRTVNKHLEQIFPKLGVENRTAAAGVALRVFAKS
ncbi:response regulator transcription factor [Marinomonas mediterranea]|jgi:Response regulator containing a CheY-like receiver domain and a GGDEF domain|uniref:Two component transcriptional regulator, LuxR family n=1 Tax=Marinomonas mediterranea (strain ATCC 700492 / JCM 21426 / NBRC 103028 / MMB-1) TaxID=717774 RepID=F2JVH6_MARM1|nr:two component transcriptional regulator, LuxR family [Marinomonas mediterranea MMB-1]